MVINFSLTDPFSGRPAFNAYLLVEGTQDIPNNRTTFRFRLYARNPSGSSATWVGTPQPWTISIGGRTWTGTGSLDFRGGQASILAADNWTGWFNHNAAGNLTIGASFSFGGSVFGTAAAGNGSIVINRIPKPPGKPPTPTFQSASTTSINFGIAAPSDNGGAAISTYNIQASRDSAFTNLALAWDSGSANQVASPLNPGTTHWIRYRAVNSRGPGPWSDAMSAATLPAVPPGMTVTPSISGTSVTVALTPPGGVSSVTSYRVERRPVGGAATVYNSPTSPIVISPMTPGTTHEYRASAFIGTYQTPWTAWVTRTQPQPNTSPGDYFDGSTAARGDLTFAWLGTVNNSVSKARGVGAAGWSAGIAAGVSGSTVVQRITGGRSGTYSARMIVLGDANGVGVYFGQDPANVASRSAVGENGVYWGSLYVRPSRAQRLAAEITWYDGVLGILGRSEGDSALVTNLTGWTRLVAFGQAPAGTVYAVVRAKDVAGTGWAPWLSGEWLDADDAMMSIGSLINWFSGSTPDTAAWRYDWVGTPNASVSMATALDPEDYDPLADPDCPPIPNAPQPPAIVDDCLEETGTWRRYWAIISQDQITDWLDLVPTITIRTGAAVARQVRVRVYANPDDLPPADFPATGWEAEQIISFIPALTAMTLDGVAQRVWAEVNGAEPISADRLLYGTGGGPASWPVLSCGTPYLISFDVPLDAPEGNLSIDVALTTRML